MRATGTLYMKMEGRVDSFLEVAISLDCRENSSTFYSSVIRNHDYKCISRHNIKVLIDMLIIIQVNMNWLHSYHTCLSKCFLSPSYINASLK